MPQVKETEDKPKYSHELLKEHYKRQAISADFYRNLNFVFNLGYNNYPLYKNIEG